MSVTPVLPSVSFYVLDTASVPARLRVACRITDKAYRAGQHVLIWHSDEAELRTLDELLWTFGDDRTFIPHELVRPLSACEAPVLLTNGAVPGGAIDVLINLAPEVPACATQSLRIVEIIDAEPARREAGRSRFKAYRDRGIQPSSHSLHAE